jgi:hypothetical protein
MDTGKPCLAPKKKNIKKCHVLKSLGLQAYFRAWKSFIRVFVKKYLCCRGCGSGSGLDPDSIGSVDPVPDLESGSGSRKAKITHKS